eukprot:XP_011663765.1 PREDICTED: uncharacterized protein LOC105438096 [Strongylocentrotus purpuratus]
MNHRDVDHLIIEKPCGRTASEDLAELICSSRSLRSIKIDSTMHDVFYSVLANKAVDSKIETLDFSSKDLCERPNASRDLAQFICKMPRLMNLTLHSQYHDDFYSTSSSMAALAKIEALVAHVGDLSKRPSASRDLAQFICKMPHLTKLTLGGQYHDGFYSTSSSMASSVKLERIQKRALWTILAGGTNLINVLSALATWYRSKKGERIFVGTLPLLSFSRIFAIGYRKANHQRDN